MSRLPIVVIMTTFNRLDVATKTLESLAENLRYDDLRWIIADDGTPDPDYTAKLQAAIGKPSIVTNSQRQGVGKSKNIALREAWNISPLVLLLEDDWRLREPLDLRPYADALVANEQLGMIRFGYLSTDMIAKLVGYGDLSYLELQQGSGVYVYSGQISLRHKRFYDIVGDHKEGITPGEEELEMCIRYNGTPNAPKILWPGNYAFHFQCGPFDNIGMNSSLNGIKPE